jgi:regulator of ribonuclease activity A
MTHIDKGAVWHPARNPRGELAVKSVIIYGACRDVNELAKLDIGVVTLGCVPIKSVRRDEGQLNIDITFGGVTFHPGDYVYADNNGIITSPKALL